MATEKLEREYIIPLRKEWLKASSFKRAKKAVRAAKEFLARHMKADFEDVRLGRFLNEKLWERGIKHPPHKIKVKVIKEDDIVRAELADLTEAQKKILEDDTKASEQLRKEKEEKFKKAKEEEEKARKEAEKVAKETEDKIKKEYEKKEGQDLVTKESGIEEIRDKSQTKSHGPQQQAQHTMKRPHNEAGN